MRKLNKLGAVMFLVSFLSLQGCALDFSFNYDTETCGLPSASSWCAPGGTRNQAYLYNKGE